MTSQTDSTEDGIHIENADGKATVVFKDDGVEITHSDGRRSRFRLTHDQMTSDLQEELAHEFEKEGYQVKRLSRS